MPYIGNQPAEQFTSFATQEFSTSATTSYTLDHAVTNENEIALFINNVRQQPGSGKAYTATGTALTLSAATASTDTMYCVFLGRALQTVNPATNSITAAMVSANAITGAKLNTDVISAQTALTSAPADTDELLISDGGVLKRIDASLVGGKDFKKLATTTISSGVAAVNFDNSVVGGYNYYQLRMSNIGVSNDADDIGIKLSGDNGSSFGAIEATRAYPQSLETSSNYNVSSAGDYSYHLLTQDSEATESTDGISGAIVDIFNASNSSNHKHMISHSFTKNQNGSYYGYWTVSRNQLTDAVNYIRINNENNTLDSGTFTLYGIES